MTSISLETPVAVVQVLAEHGHNPRIVHVLIFGSTVLVLSAVVTGMLSGAGAGFVGRIARWLLGDLIGGDEGKHAGRLAGALAGGALGLMIGALLGLIDGAVVSALVGKAIGGGKGAAVASAIRPFFMAVGSLLSGAIGGITGSCLGGGKRGRCASPPDTGAA